MTPPVVNPAAAPANPASVTPTFGQPTFTVEERIAFVTEALAAVDNVTVEAFSDLVVDFARRSGARAMVKGLRAISDFEWEFQMGHLNRTLAPEIETVYVMAGRNYSFVSSSGVKEIASFGGDVSEFVPSVVAERCHEIFGNGGSPAV